MASGSSTAGTRLSLLARARQRDAAAWRELVDLYTPLVAHWIRRCKLDSSDTADCLQEVFAAVASSIDSYRPSGDSGAFRAWMWTVTRNKVRDLIRRKQRHPPQRGGSTAWETLQQVPAEAEIPDEEPTGEDQIHELVRRGLMQVQAEFEPATWQAFWRTAIDGIATAVVAEELGLSPATVRQYRSRVMRRLRERLGDVQ